MCDRIERLRSTFDQHGLEAMLITNPINMRYLCGFTGDVGLLLISDEDSVLAVDPRYTEQAKREVGSARVVETREAWADALAALAADCGLRAVGVESDYVTVNQWNTWRDRLGSATELVPVCGLVARLRTVKSPAEIDRLTAAVALTDEALAAARDWLRPGVTEAEVAWFIEVYIRTHGGEAMAFDPVVGAGPNGAMAHARPGPRPLAPGEPVVIDIGARVDGYCGDLTRTLCLGAPDERFREIYDIVLAAQKAAEAGIRPGMTGKEADALARDVITSAGFGEAFGHGLGHGVGLAIHEDPRLSSRSADILEPGNVVTVEPGIYVEGWGGVRIEDVVMLTESGIEILTRSVKDPYLCA
jgi:Xaa-Pro aminopeptidase